MANNTHHVIIDVATTSETTTLPRHQLHDVDDDGRLRVSLQTSNHSSSPRRGGGRNSRSPLNSGFWISFEFIFTLSQIIASVIVLNSSRDEHPHAPLFAWIVGYASGCVVSLPLLLWRYFARDQSSSQTNSRTDDPSGTLISNSTAIHGEDDVPVVASASSRNNRAPSRPMNGRPKLLMEYFKTALDLFFAIWFVVGNVWIFGGHASANDAPNLYRLCIVFLTFSCIGYAMPFILCLTICCCLPCIISTLGVTEDLAQTRGATSESINALPTRIFKTMKSKNNDESDNTPVIEGGIVAEGTEKERMISGEDAVCCICIANYENDDELRELPCSHLFHRECVDKWLKINALCPLCKSEIGENVTGPIIEENANQQRGENRVENGLASTSS